MWQQITVVALVACAAIYLIGMAVRRYRAREQMDAACSNCSLVNRTADPGAGQPE
jgi:hypothetical protein